MTLIVDAGPLIASSDVRDSRRRRVQQILSREPGRLIVPAPITAEVDYLLDARFGRGRDLPFLEKLASGAFEVECLLPEEYTDIVALQRKYLGFAPGLADLSSSCSRGDSTPAAS